MSNGISTSSLSQYVEGTARTWNHKPIVAAHHFELCNAALGLAGEASELHNEIDILSENEIVSELGDILYYSARVVDFLQANRYIPHNFEALTTEGQIFLSTVLQDGGYDTFESYSNALTIEAGKIAEYVKKTVFHGKDITEDKWIASLTSIFANATAIAHLIDTDLENIAEQNLAKLAARYPEGFRPGGGIR